MRLFVYELCVALFIGYVCVRGTNEWKPLAPSFESEHGDIGGMIGAFALWSIPTLVFLWLVTLIFPVTAVHTFTSAGIIAACILALRVNAVHYPRARYEQQTADLACVLPDRLTALENMGNACAAMFAAHPIHAGVSLDAQTAADYNDMWQLLYENTDSAWYRSGKHRFAHNSSDGDWREYIRDHSNHHDLLRGFVATCDTFEQRLRVCYERIPALTHGITRATEEYMRHHTALGLTTDDRPVVYASLADRYRHTYVIGTTGSGKSNLLIHLIQQDLDKGHGVIVISPEDDLFQKLLPLIPAHRADDLIYFDPTDITPPIIGFNPFVLDPHDDLTQKGGEVYTVFERSLGDLGVTMSPLFKNATFAFLQTPHATIRDFRPLLAPHDRTLRDRITKNPAIDDETRIFWEEYDTTMRSYYQKSYSPLLNRLSDLLRPPLSVALSTPSFSFTGQLNATVRILFCNLSRLRGDPAVIMGQLLMAQLQQTLFARDFIPEDQRPPYFCYIDEFQTYAATNEQSCSDLFTRARKYNMGVILAHQNTTTIPSKLLSTIVSNAGTVCCLQLAAEDAPQLARELQLYDISTDRYGQTTRGSFDTLALQNLPTGHAYVRTPAERQGVHIRIPYTDTKRDDTKARALIARSKTNYGKAPTAVLQQESFDDDTAPAAEIADQSPSQRPRTPPRRPRRPALPDDETYDVR